MTQVQGNNLLDVLKKKMRQTKEEMEKYKEESEDMARKLQVEIRRREEVSLYVGDMRPMLPLPALSRTSNPLRIFALESVGFLHAWLISSMRASAVALSHEPWVGRMSQSTDPVVGLFCVQCPVSSAEHWPGKGSPGLSWKGGAGPGGSSLA